MLAGVAGPGHRRRRVRGRPVAQHGPRAQGVVIIPELVFELSAAADSARRPTHRRAWRYREAGGRREAVDTDWSRRDGEEAAARPALVHCSGTRSANPDLHGVVARGRYPRKRIRRAVIATEYPPASRREFPELVFRGAALNARRKCDRPTQ